MHRPVDTYVFSGECRDGYCALADFVALIDSDKERFAAFFDAAPVGPRCYSPLFYGRSGFDEDAFGAAFRFEGEIVCVEIEIRSRLDDGK